MALVGIVLVLQLLWLDSSAEESIIVRIDRSKDEHGETQMDGGNNENNLDKATEVRMHSRKFVKTVILFIYFLLFMYIYFLLFISFSFFMYFPLFYFIFIGVDTNGIHQSVLEKRPMIMCITKDVMS